MARSRTLLQLRDEVRQRADMVNSAFVTDAEVDRCINQSWAQLYDRLLATGEDYYIKYVDITLPAGQSVSPPTPSAYSLSSVGLTPFACVSPTLLAGSVWMADGQNHVAAVSPTTGQLLAYALAGNPLRREACSNGTEFVVIANNGPEQVIGFTPSLPPASAFATTSWSPALGANEDVDTANGVYFDSATNQYVTMVRDTVAYTSRLLRFTVVGTVATISASLSLPAAPSIQDVAQMLYSRPGFVGIWSVGGFHEVDVSTMTITTTVAHAAKLDTAAYDSTTARVVAVAQTAPHLPVFDIGTATQIGTLDAALVAAGGTPGAGFPRSVGGKWWLSTYFVPPPPLPTVAAFPLVAECDPATLAVQPILSVLGTGGLWADSFAPGVALLHRTTFPLGVLSGQEDSFGVYAFSSATGPVQTSTDFADFQNYTASNGQPAIDVYQVRGVDAVYSSSVIVNVPRYNWEERNVYSGIPEVAPYSPISAYRVIQNPINGNDCIEFIPATPNGVSYYRVWYYPNPKVLTAPTDTIDGRSGWEEWVVIDAAMKLLAKEESDTSALEREAQRVWARVMAVAENRDAGQGKRITDVAFNSGAWPYPTGFTRRY